MEVVVFASFVPKPGQEAEVENLLRGMVAPTRGEPGCKRYDLYRIAEGPTTFHLFEIYADQEALMAHRAADHYKAYRAAIPDFLAEPIGVKVLRGMDVKG